MGVVAEVSVGYSCGVRILHSRRVSVKRWVGVEPEAGAGAVVYIFLKECCFRTKLNAGLALRQRADLL